MFVLLLCFLCVGSGAGSGQEKRRIQCIQLLRPQGDGMSFPNCRHCQGTPQGTIHSSVKNQTQFMKIESIDFD